MTRTNQSGSILGFVVVGLVMALLLVGGVYLVRHRLVPASKETPVVVNDNEPNPEQPADNGSVDEDSVSDDQPSESSDNQKETSAPEDNLDESTPEDSTQAEPESTPSGSLPQTGPGDMVVAGLLFSSVVGLAVAYVRSLKA